MEITNRLFVYKDLYDGAIDYLGSSVAGDAARDAKRAVQSGYRSFAADG